MKKRFFLFLLFLGILSLLSCERQKRESSANEQPESSLHTHIPVIEDAVAPTCKKEGQSEGSHCKICGKILTAQDSIPALGHSVIIDDPVTPSCITEGKTAGAHCSICGEILVTPKILPAGGHIEVTDAPVAPTCISEGKTAGKHCKMCGKILLPQETLPIHHTYHQKTEAPAFLASPATETHSAEYYVSCICGEKGEDTFFADVNIAVYVNNDLQKDLISTDETTSYRITPPAYAEYVFTDSREASYFCGWFLDSQYTVPLEEDHIFTKDTAIYGKMLTSKLSHFTYEVQEGKATITGYLDTEATSLVIPAYINSFPVTTIAAKAFQNNTILRYVIFDDSVTTIETYAFSGCNSIELLQLPNTLTTIGSDAFENCTSLMSIAIPKSVKSISFSAFENCTNLSAVHITDIAAWCQIEFRSMQSNPLAYAQKLYLNGTLITELTIPDEISAIGEYAFYKSSSLTEITIGKSITSIGKMAFDSCKDLTDIYYIGSKTEWNAIKKGAYWDRNTGVYTIHCH